MKKKYWALSILGIIIVLQWIGFGFDGKLRFAFFTIILVLIVLFVVLLWKK